MGDLAPDTAFPRSAKHGQRRVVTMWRDWNNLRKAVASGDPVATQEAFDLCEPWVDWCFGQAAERPPHDRAAPDGDRRQRGDATVDPRRPCGPMGVQR